LNLAYHSRVNIQSFVEAYYTPVPPTIRWIPSVQEQFGEPPVVVPGWLVLEGKIENTRAWVIMASGSEAFHSTGAP
jgi:hypothetical protein